MNALEHLRAALPPVRNPRFWRALDELVDDPGRRGLLHAALPQLADMEPAMDRRGFLRLLGASLAFAGLTGCSGPPPEHIVAERGGDGGAVPDTARYATALDIGGDIVGVVATLRDGRPVKLDGNPNHPMTLGGSDPRLQAAILDAWDPARSDAPRFRGRPANWSEFEQALAAVRTEASRKPAELHILTPLVHSQTLARQRDALLAAFPGATWHTHEPTAMPGGPPPDLARFDVIVAFDADLLGTMPGHLAAARAFARARERGARLYSIEPTPSLTGRNADHAWPVDPSSMARVSAALADALAGVATADARVATIADDLRRHAGRACVIAGPWVDDATRANVARVQAALGQPVAQHAPTTPPTLVTDLRQGLVRTLIVLEANAAYSLPGFAEAAKHAGTLIHLGRYRDETAMLAPWHLPALHPLETWSDLVAADGTASIVQPVLTPLVDGRSVHDVVDMLLGIPTPDALGRVRATWPAIDDAAWRVALQRGALAGTHAVGDATRGSTRSQPPAPSSPPTLATDALEVVFRPDPNTWDGRFAHNAWLQELPRTVTTLAWGNALLIAPALAQERGLTNGDVARLAVGGRTLEGPVLLVPGQAMRTITVTLGNGRREGLGTGYGYNGYALREADHAWSATGATLTPVGRTEALALLQAHQDMGTREAVRIVASGAGTAPPKPAPSFYAAAAQGGHRWAMTIDLSACIGCNACTVACQAENNIPVAGKTEVARGRRMHWIRVDGYFEGTAAAPRGFHQPVPCMHCEHAPCEVVCPVEATVHDHEGLNLQVYNRCIGTRFCANNCPYKVRRFNFLQYSDLVSESLKAMRNPDVTVRNKGVMEKCTYCVQRIEGAHAAAVREQRQIGADEVTTACQDACPTQAIAFGDLDQPNEALAAGRRSTRAYTLLEELNTRPRTTYLAAIRNPHPGWPAT